MASTNPIKKAAAARIVFPIYDNAGNLLSGATGKDAEYSLDGGGFNSIASTVQAIGTTGFYYVDLAAGETNGDVLALQVKTTSATGKTSALVFYTAGQTLNELQTSVTTMSNKATSILVDTGTTLYGVLNTTYTNTDSILEDLLSIETKINLIDGVVDAILTDTGTTLEAKLTLVHKLLKNKMVVSESGSTSTLYDDNGTTPIYTWALTDKNGSVIAISSGSPTSRGTPT
jgi:hypothetical protein